MPPKKKSKPNAGKKSEKTSNKDDVNVKKDSVVVESENVKKSNKKREMKVKRRKIMPRKYKSMKTIRYPFLNWLIKPRRLIRKKAKNNPKKRSNVIPKRNFMLFVSRMVQDQKHYITQRKMLFL